MLELFYDRRTGSFTPLCFILLGTLVLGVGFFLLDVTLEAVMGGRQYAGPAFRRQMSNRLDADISAVLSLFVVIVGATYIYAGFCQALPFLERRRWFRWLTALVFGPLILLLLAASAFVVAGKIFRL